MHILDFQFNCNGLKSRALNGLPEAVIASFDTSKSRLSFSLVDLGSHTRKPTDHPPFGRCEHNTAQIQIPGVLRISHSAWFVPSTTQMAIRPPENFSLLSCLHTANFSSFTKGI